MKTLWQNINQHDPLWAGAQLGHGPETIGSHGSLLACFAILAGTDPCRMNTWRLRAGGYEPGSSHANSFDLEVEGLAGGRKIDVAYNSGRYCSIPFPGTEETRLLDHLKHSHPAIIEVDCVPEGSLAESHFVLGVGMEAGHIRIIDPWDGETCMLLPRYGCRDNRAINRAILYEVKRDHVRPIGIEDRPPVRARAGRDRYQRE